MPVRKWTDEQKAKQSALIHSWQPWKTSTGPRTPAGKKISSMNAVNYSIREVGRELARQNRALIAYINGSQIAPCWERTAMDKLLDKVGEAINAPITQRTKKAKPKTASASKKPTAEPVAA